MNASAFEFSFPVLATKSGTQEKTPERRQVFEVYGTAFPIGGDAFLTAAHVIDGIKAREGGADISIGVARGGPGARWLGIRCSRFQTFAPLDVGVVHADVGEVSAFRWRPSEVNMLDEVWAAGYPHAFDRQASVIVVRAFRGYVVSEGRFRELPAAPAIYELSFHAPRGLSGAPLCHKETGSVAGMVLGNRIVSMTVFHDTETLKEGGVVHEVRREEAMHLGVALKVTALLDVKLESLGGTIGDWLSKHGLLRSS